MRNIFLCLCLLFANSLYSAEPPYVTAERAAVLALVTDAKATHFSANSGKWIDASTWVNGEVPTDGSRVVIAANHEVEIHTQLVTKIKTIRVDGTLSFCRQCDTRLWCSLLVVNMEGKVDMGTEASPISGQCEFVFPAVPIDINEDPFEFGNGIVSMAPMFTCGQYKTGQVDVFPVMVGATSISLVSAPIGWKLGDKLVIAGTDRSAFDTFDRLLITGFGVINNGGGGVPSPLGTVIQVTRADANWQPVAGGCKYKHELPSNPYNHKPFVINLTRNVVIRGEKYGYGVVPLSAAGDPKAVPPPEVKTRPHVMLMHGGAESQILNTEVSAVGRQDKRVCLNVVKLQNGVRIPGSGTNQIGRYGLHFHRGDFTKLGLARGVSVHNAPGWGITNHSSNVIIDDCVGFECVSSFNTETGIEKGAIRNCAAIYGINTGVSQDGRLNTVTFPDTPDQGTLGPLWLQGTGVECENLKLANSWNTAFTLWCGAGKETFGLDNSKEVIAAIDPVNVDPEDSYLLAYADPVEGTIAVNAQAVKRIDNILVINGGAQILNVALGQFRQGQSIGKRSLVTRIFDYGKGCELNYCFGVDLEDGYTDSLFTSLPSPAYHGIRMAGNSMGNTVSRFTAKNWGTGITAGRNGFNEIRDCNLHAAVGIHADSVKFSGIIPGSFLFPREYHVSGNVFAPASTTKLSWGSKNAVTSAMDRFIFNGKQLYSPNAAASVVPYPTASPTLVYPSYFAGKTNAQLLAEYGYCMHGDVNPSDAANDPTISQLTGTPSIRAAIKLLKATKQPEVYPVKVTTPNGEQGFVTVPAGTLQRLQIEIYYPGNPVGQVKEIDVQVLSGWQPVFWTESTGKYGVHVKGTP